MTETETAIHIPPGVTLPANSPLWIHLPVEAARVQEVRTLLASGNMLLTEISELILNDPVFTLEILSFANRATGPGSSTPVFSVNAALFRLGAQGMGQLFDDLALRTTPSDPLAQEEMFKLRTLGVQISLIAQILAGITSRENAEDARSTALLAVIGQLLACYKFGREYAELAASMSRPSLIYRLNQDRRFDVRTGQLAYLKSRRIPQRLYFVFDREFACKAPGQAELRFIVDSAYELVENFEHGKFDRYRPGVELPGKSSLRLLGVTPKQQEQIYEQCLAHFTAVRKRDLPPEETPAEVVVAEGAPAASATTEIPEIEYIEAGESAPVEQGFEFSSKAQEFFTVIEDLFKSQRKTDELLSNLLTLLVSAGPYQRAALLVMQNNRKLAVVHALAGQSAPTGKISVDDPISPLALMSTKIRSFNATEVVDFHAPFGISAYAMSPIKVTNLPPVLLYVDCGQARCLPFEGRKIFRLVVGLLNNFLSQNGVRQ
ncbi:MAG: HDOD domain-containing protein [Deltaproteobacteria bacterium]|nr:HDOD domain-containing protein [Deltaproteobacteria bacterium]